MQDAGKTLVSDAKSDFPSETSALQTSVTALGTTVGQLTDSATRKAALASIPAEVTAVKSAAGSLSSATKSKCD